MARRIDLAIERNDKLFKSYNKFGHDHFSNKRFGFKFELETYHNYLSDAVRHLKHADYDEFSRVKTKKGMKQLMEASFGTVKRLLHASAAMKTTDSWMKMRKSLQVAYYAAGLSELGEEIGAMTNPVQVSGRSHNTKKAKRIAKVTPEIYDEFKDALEDSEFEVASGYELLETIEIIRRTGMRPEELIEARVISQDDDEIVIAITGAKKTLKGKDIPKHKRGIDRVLTVKNNPLLANAVERLGSYDGHKIGALQERLSRLSRRLRPNSDKQLALYSFRYTYGSDLKRNLYEIEGGRIIAAAIMGHKNTSSISSYGHYQSGTLNADIPDVGKDALDQVIDDVGRRFGKIGKNFDIGEKIRYERDLNAFKRKMKGEQEQKPAKAKPAASKSKGQGQGLSKGSDLFM